ncbi:hypothetical protein [Cellvibrio polysaccharolyticus]|uniref:Uncharacterized protein n=1 Tax=Cellvibrio polysaccharolyticus TaxID=2082724 RepID=A0A928V877_9GAMM|nr:hypothetical protein [Cellvibrio polysaccharolyticus]MBE8718502.1 hypothetical protein [Cellvibrio polysaccharolyticus]
MAFKTHAWTSGNFGDNKLLKVRVSIDDEAESIFDPLVEYEVFEMPTSVLLGEGQFPLSAQDPERLLAFVRDCKADSEETRVVLPVHQLAYDMVLDWAQEKFV